MSNSMILVALYASLAIPGLMLLRSPRQVSARAAITSRWDAPVAIAPVAPPGPVFCESTRRWRDPVTRRFVKAPVL